MTDQEQGKEAANAGNRLRVDPERAEAARLFLARLDQTTLAAHGGHTAADHNRLVAVIVSGLFGRG